MDHANLALEPKNEENQKPTLQRQWGDLAAFGIGSYERDPDTGFVHGDAAMAAHFGIEPDELAAGVPMPRFSEGIHPADRHLWLDRVSEIEQKGGLVVMEYRTIPQPGSLRWILVRGMYQPRGSHKIAPGYGITMDVTRTHLPEASPQPFIVVNNEPLIHPLEKAADLAMALRAILRELGAHKDTDLGCVAETMLILIGRALASLQVAGHR